MAEDITVIFRLGINISIVAGIIFIVVSLFGLSEENLRAFTRHVTMSFTRSDSQELMALQNDKDIRAIMVYRSLRFQKARIRDFVLTLKDGTVITDYEELKFKPSMLVDVDVNGTSTGMYDITLKEL